MTRAFLILDVVAAAALAVVMIVLFSMATGQLVAAQRDCDARQRLRLAAETELSRLRAGIVALPSQEAITTTRVVGPITIETTIRPGSGSWSGLTHVAVVARRQVQGYWARVELSAYLPNVAAGLRSGRQREDRP